MEIRDLATPEVRAPGRAAAGWCDEQLATRAREALDAVAGLCPRQRRLIGLHIAGYSYREIAAIEGCSYTAVNRHLTRARAALRTACDGQGG